MQRRLLAEPDLTLKNALAIAQGMEAAEISSKVIQEEDHSTTSVSVHKVTKSVVEQLLKQNPRCYRCDGQHLPQDCRFKEAICHFCTKKGHIAKACRSRKKKNFEQVNVGSRAHQIVECPENDGEIPQDEYSIFTVGSSKSQPILVEVKLNGVKNEMELDTGAAISLVSQQAFQGFVNSEIELKPTTVKLRSYSGHELKVKG